MLSAGDRPVASEPPEPRRLSRPRIVVARLQKGLQQFFPSRDNDEEDRIPTAQDQENNLRHQNLVDNIQDVKEYTAEDVMVPRADIVAIPITTTHDELMTIYLERPHTRLPVYQDTLDDIIGFIHIKDVLATMAAGKRVEIRDLLRDVMIISPALPVLNLLVDMQQSKRQLAVVVDEYGGIDGLVAMNNIIEAIVGEIKDEHINTRSPRLIDRGDGVILADARVYIEDFEDRYGEILTEEEREEIDTLGGLVMAMAGHLPVRGESLMHPSGWQFEIIDADPRRVKRLRLRPPENASISM
ncbi:MAG TPA: hemolysin family protein [Alphaproteobacteria bacterium]